METYTLSLLTAHITFSTLCPESALVSAWNSDSNLSLLIVRHPLARLVSVYYNKLVQCTTSQYSTVQCDTVQYSVMYREQYNLFLFYD